MVLTVSAGKLFGALLGFLTFLTVALVAWHYLWWVLGALVVVMAIGGIVGACTALAPETDQDRERIAAAAVNGPEAEKAMRNRIVGERAARKSAADHPVRRRPSTG